MTAIKADGFIALAVLWGFAIKNMSISDPFGDRLTFTEAIST